MSSSRRLLLVHAHPDDESIATGGTIARYVAEGVEVFLVTCTLGEEGEIIPPDLAQLGVNAGNQLGGYRAGELARACAALGVTEQFFLGGIGRWRDSGMAGESSANHPRALVHGSLREQTDHLSQVIAAVRPQVVISYDAFGGYGHPDHIRANEITMAATSRSELVTRTFCVVRSARVTAEGLEILRSREDIPFEIPEGWELPSANDTKISSAIDISAYRAARLKALRAHATQVSVWESKKPSDFAEEDQLSCFALSDGLAQPLPDVEYFVLADGPAQGIATDLFGGLS